MTDSEEILDEAWGHIPQSRDASASIGSFTRLRVERIISAVAGAGSLVLGAQALVVALGSTIEQPGWHEPLVLAVFVPLAFMTVACFVGRGVKFFAGLFAFAYVGVLALWPLAAAGSDAPLSEAPWPWHVANIATLAAVLAFPLPIQLASTVLIPLLYGLVRLIAVNFATGIWYYVIIEVSFSLIFGGVLLTLAWVFRSVAVGVDETRARAVESYSRAAAANAAEQERVAVAALMHDSVLAALIAAERSDTPRGRVLAVAMAREALTRLANTEQDAGEGSDEVRTAESIAEAIETASRELGMTIAVHREIRSGDLDVPGRISRALVLAATQAVANAVEHAGGVGLEVSLYADDERVNIEVRDAGGGFDMAAVPDDRLGIRASIIARVAAVGGSTDVESDAAGTTVRLEWRPRRDAYLEDA
ncbi:MAG: ATP-binding protein [Microbacterium sp.]